MSNHGSHGKHVARKRFGQHFLTDSGVIDGIVRAIDPRPGDAMVEIGPGLAALTQPLVERLGPDEGMLFPMDPPRMAGFWMRNTVIPLDIIYIGLDRRILNIAANECEQNEASFRQY